MDRDRIVQHIREIGFLDKQGCRFFLASLKTRHIVVAEEFLDAVLKALDTMPSGLRIAPRQIADFNVQNPAQAVEVGSTDDESTGTQVEEDSDDGDVHSTPATISTETHRIYGFRVYSWIRKHTFVDIPTTTVSEGQHTVSSAGHDVRQKRRRIDESQSTLPEDSQASTANLQSPGTQESQTESQKLSKSFSQSLFFGDSPDDFN